MKLGGKEMIQLHHVAIVVNDFDKYVDLFLRLGMNIQRITGETPNRQLWFEEGIQLKESHDESADGIDHIALGSNNRTGILKTAIESNCSLIMERDNWFRLPNGISIELMED